MKITTAKSDFFEEKKIHLPNQEKARADMVDFEILLWNISVNDDERSFRQLFELYYPALCVYAKRFIEEKETREDIVQDVFLSIWENRKNISVQVSVKNYLLTCVKNHCLNYLRQHTTESVEDLFIKNIPIYAENNDDFYMLTELRELLAKSISKLPEEYRHVFELNRFEGKNYREIAESMDISTRTVERYKNKAIEILKKDLKDYLPLLALFL
ncbi:RNA polymerase sigma-70 factor [Parabacteroides sp.]|uniref:RNA polymerase sigma-70 factor n=1 Tax=Parabacteroides sp. TaxID=1869337 RepID=UPI00257C1DC7|nr:RNA polymerase sigma-70 factor [Parabacteroides sp.]